MRPAHIDLLRHGETANAPSAGSEGPRLVPIGETAGGARYCGTTDAPLTAAG